MPRRNPARRVVSGRTRNTESVTLSLWPARKAELDALAARLAPTGQIPDRSATVVELVRFILDAEADGLVEIEDGRIRFRRPAAD
jgi:hypothetical protein